MFRLSSVLLFSALACTAPKPAVVVSRVESAGTAKEASTPRGRALARAASQLQPQPWWAEYARRCGPLGGDPRLWQVEKPPLDGWNPPDRYPRCEWKVDVDAGVVTAAPSLPREEPALPFVPLEQPTLHIVRCEGEANEPREPDAPLKVRDYLSTPTGFLVGYNSGEFGGELWWFDREGNLEQIIARENVIRILKTADGILAFAGIAHLTLDRGSVLKLTPRTHGWDATQTDLPGAPDAVLALPDGAIFVVTTEHLVRIDAGAHVTVLHHGRWGGSYANSLVQDRDGSFYVGIRYFVVRLRPDTTGFREEWLVPSGTQVLGEDEPG